MVFEKENKKDKTKENLKKPTTHYYCERRTPPRRFVSSLVCFSRKSLSLSHSRLSLSLSRRVSFFGCWCNQFPKLILPETHSSLCVEYMRTRRLVFRDDEVKKNHSEE
jgi:hypothetical protein